MKNEKYFWENAKGELIPKHEISDYYVCNIVMKFGKDWLVSHGHQVIVDRFERLNKEHKFFNILIDKE